ncbi:TPA: outer membrane usher protein [Klebsiella aerogenes]|nr:outer membrane usher protein [Klebsiella aerogenes]
MVAHKKNRIIKLPLVIIFVFVFCSSRSARSEYSVEFNADVLDVKDRKNIDLNHFSKAGYIMPGKYQMVVRINKSELPEKTLNFYVPDNDPNGSVACLTPELVKDFGLKEKFLSGLSWWHKNQCLSTDSLKGMTLKPDLGSNTLYINIPQAYLEYTAENWDPPSRWDNGISGVLADYNLSALTTKLDSSKRIKNLSGNGTVGANGGAWRFRADWQEQYQSSNTGSIQQKWLWSRFYAFRAITSLEAKLLIGENYLDSSMFDSFRYTGISFFSDDQQLPPNLRGYSPEVTGVAKTNAKVTVSQQGRVVYETTVAAGPFRIQDLNSTVSGKLDVKIQEQDGSIQTFQIDTSNIPYLTRPGLVRYKISTGKPSDYGHHTQGDQFVTGEFSWGINNGWSLYGGSIFAGQYNAGALGIGRDLMALGALSFDLTHSSAELPKIGHKTGSSYRLSYSKRFEKYDSQVTFAGYRFSERDFMSMPQYLDARYNNGTTAGRGKELYTVTMDKQFRDLNVSSFLTYNHQTYWDREPSDSLNFSISNYFDIGNFKNLSFSFSAYRSINNRIKDDGLYLGLSLPWGNEGRLGYSGQYFGKEVGNSVSFYNTIDHNNDYRVSVGTNNNGRNYGSGYYTHEGDIAEISANTSFRNYEYNAFGLSLRGGITATAHGIALHRIGQYGGTRMMVDTDGINDVPIRGEDGITHSNYFGEAVVNDINSYYRNNVNVDLDNLPDDIEASRSVVEDTLTEGAIGYRKFGIIGGKKSMVILRLSNGSVPPFGATIVNESGEQTGIISDDGAAWLAGIKPGEWMNVIWDGEVKCRINIPNPLPPLSKKIMFSCNVPIVNR